MTTLDINLDEKRNLVDGKLTQMKGSLREQLGTLQNDDLTRLAGKKDQVMGQLQATFSDSWIMRYRGWVLAGSVAAFLGSVLTIILARELTSSTES